MAPCLLGLGGPPRSQPQWTWRLSHTFADLTGRYGALDLAAVDSGLYAAIGSLLAVTFPITLDRLADAQDAAVRWVL